ncbi:TonB-dependent receptor domain-containing protein [Reichenbachiella versicolor]|uniref:TonB-dependent receptor domain-containing protein n=1 Tax=Reichenbachiella versicolor TaxID=1821036 RepID=UPI0013A5A438|nr:TonB-dependent receptor [Reichenbachiella versicolor]
MKKIFLSGVIVCMSLMAMAQTGFVRGTIIDGATGEGLFGATVTKTGTSQGAITDFDGKFSLTLPVGTHDISISFVSYTTQTIQGVVVKEGEVSSIDVTLEENVAQLEAVVVTAEQIRDNDVALLSVQKKSANTVDGLSSQAFKKIGDSNLSGAMKRVTGVTVQGGKYVYVRGLGDRYTKTTLNGMVVPGLDPDRNDVQMDIFPTAILENVMVYKTFSPDLNGDFAGGLLDVQTKSFPDEEETSISLSLGYNPSMHFNSDNVSYNSSSTDWVGFDNGQRELTISQNADIPNQPGSSEKIETLSSLTREFDPTLGASKQTSFMNYGFSVAHRNQKPGENWTLGYNVILNYKVTSTFYDDYERNQFLIDITDETPEIARDYTSVGSVGKVNTLWSGLGSIAMKTDNHTISGTFLHTQNGTKNAVERTISRSSLNNPGRFYNDILTYTQRSMSNAILSGKHRVGDLQIDWSNSLLFSKIHDLDYRDTKINTEDDQLDFKNGGGINRFWRYLDETSETFKLDLTYEVAEGNKLKVGGQAAWRGRTFDIAQYNYQPEELYKPETNDANDLLKEENLISEDNINGLRISDNNNDFNEYEGTQLVTAGYVMNDWKFTEKFRAIYGVRLEKTDMYYSGDYRDSETGSTETFDKEKTLDDLSFLPSVGLVYSVTEDMNIRGSFNKTLARPSFKEKSAAFIDDPLNLQIFSGNLDVEMAEILNYDLRWEYYFTPSEMVSVSVFYKDFTNHIALAASPLRPEQVTPRNVGSANVMGAEFEVRKGLGSFTSSLENFSVGMNLSIVRSEVDRKTVVVDFERDGTPITEYDAEVNFLETEEGVDRYRTMTGQSPYALNIFMNYDMPSTGLSANVAYNVQGENIAIIGVSSAPSVYSMPFKSLNLKVSKSLGQDERSSLSVSVKNILDDQKEMLYKFNGEDRVFSKYSPGTRFDIGYSYRF